VDVAVGVALGSEVAVGVRITGAVIGMRVPLGVGVACMGVMTAVGASGTTAVGVRVGVRVNVGV
jgi:hypothetical protein